MTCRIIQTIRLYIQYYFVDSRIDLKLAKEPKLIEGQSAPAKIQGKSIQSSPEGNGAGKEGQPLDEYILDIISNSPKTLAQILQAPRLKSCRQEDVLQILEDVNSS